MNHKMPFLLCLAVACVCRMTAAPPSDDKQIFALGFMQSSKDLKADWAAIPKKDRDRISGHLIAGEGLGLSAVGHIYLADSFKASSGAGTSSTRKLLQFQQIHLRDQLFWIVLIDTEEMTCRILYHHDQTKIAAEPTPIKSL